MSWFSTEPNGFTRPSSFPPSGKKQIRSISAVLHGHNGLMWLAAKGALACLLLILRNSAISWELGLLASQLLLLLFNILYAQKIQAANFMQCTCIT